MLNSLLIYYNFKTNFYPGLEHRGNWDHSSWWKLFWAGFNFHCSVQFTSLKVNKAIHISKPHTDDGNNLCKDKTLKLYTTVFEISNHTFIAV